MKKITSFLQAVFHVTDCRKCVFLAVSTVSNVKNYLKKTGDLFHLTMVNFLQLLAKFTTCSSRQRMAVRVYPAEHSVVCLAKKQVFKLKNGILDQFWYSLLGSPREMTWDFTNIHEDWADFCQFDICMPRDFTNIHEDWTDFCQCQEFLCHFLSLILEGEMALLTLRGFFERLRAPFQSQIRAISSSKMRLEKHATVIYHMHRGFFGTFLQCKSNLS